jgi:DNA-binding response OmpR family regulator
LLDLPDMAGLTLVRRLQAERALRTIPIVTFGPPSTASLAGYVVDLGARTHLTVPFDVARLLALLQQLLAYGDYWSNSA